MEDGKANKLHSNGQKNANRLQVSIEEPAENLPEKQEKKEKKQEQEKKIFVNNRLNQLLMFRINSLLPNKRDAWPVKERTNLRTIFIHLKFKYSEDLNSLLGLLPKECPRYGGRQVQNKDLIYKTKISF